MGSDISWEPDGRSLLAIDRPAAYGRSDYEITRYDTTTWEMTHHFIEEQILMNDDVVVLRDNDTDQMTVLDRTTFETVETMDAVDHMLVTADHRLITVNLGSMEVMLWEINDQGLAPLREIEVIAELSDEQRAEWKRTDSLLGLSFDEANKSVWIGKGDGNRRNWSADTGERLPDSLYQTPPPAVFSGITVVGKVEEETVRFRLLEGADQDDMAAQAHEGYHPIQVLYYSEDHTRIIIASDPDLYIWDGVADKILFQGRAWAKQQYLPRAVVDPQGQSVAVSYQIGPWGEGTIDIFDLETMTRLDRINREAYALYWSRDGHRLIAVTHDTLSLLFVP